MRPYLLLRAFSVSLFFAGIALPARAASFSAELLDQRAGQTQTGAFYFQDKSYRFELVAGGQRLIVLFDAPTGTTRLLAPSDKLFMEGGPDAPLSRMTNPFAFYAYYARTSDIQTEGTEEIGGVACTRQVLASNGQLYCTAWYSPEYGLPLKVDVPILGQTVEVRGIKPGPQDAAFFVVPADYTRAPDPGEEPPPEWAAQVASAPVLTPPFEQTVTEGKMIRLGLQAGRTIFLRFTNARQESSAFTSVGFKDGRPTSSLSGNTMNLSADDEVSSSVSRKPDEVDDYVIRVGIGSIKIKATVEPAGGTSSAAAEAPEFPAGVSAPATVGMASRFEVTWSGPGATNDLICVALPGHPPGRDVTRVAIRSGNPVKIWAPNDPGEYEVRYVLGTGTKVLAKVPITVAAVTASVAIAGTIKAAGWIEVTWEGPAIDGDYITVAQPAQGDGSSVERSAVRQGNPLRIRAPGDPGRYEVRYLLSRATKVLARVPLIVEEVTATVSPPATVKAGTDFEVSWTGPGYGEDVITVAREDQPPGARLSSVRAGAGASTRLRAPKEPGVYEVRYILGRGNRLLAKATITIEVP